MPPLTAENSHFLRSGSQEAALVMWYKSKRKLIKTCGGAREIKFIGLFGDRGQQGPYQPYKPCNHNLYIGIIIFPHIDNAQSTGYN